MGYPFQDINAKSWLSVPLCIWISWSVGLCIYRLLFHPLAKVPGPFLAKITYWYEIYYDVIHSGQYTFKLKDMHAAYGPAIRINPNEIHINDPDYLDEVFNFSNGKTNKSYREANAFGPFPAITGTEEHDLHRTRRAALNPFFSRKTVLEKLQHIPPIIESLCNRLTDASKTGERINLKYAYSALAMDVVTEYCFSKPANTVFILDFNRKANDDLHKFLKFVLWNTHFPWLMPALYSVPEWLARLIHPAMADMFDFRQMLSEQIEAICSQKKTSYEGLGRRTMFHTLIESKLPPPEKERDRMRDEAFGVVAAGADTTAHVLRNVSYHITASPDIHDRLLTELKSVMPSREDAADLLALEKLPLLTAIIHEGLRLSHVASHRVQRVFRDKTLRYKSIVLPPGTEIAMTSGLIHEDPTIFPEPYRFNPDRWLVPDQQRLLRYMTPFSRGPRACIGITLAWAEMYLVLATVFRRFEFDVSGVRRERDIDMTRDHIVGANAVDSPGVVVGVKCRIS
ncbi:MAG: hypothetical protein Q9160_009065 [Pyrenula sp. 1 TL-2023]